MSGKIDGILNRKIVSKWDIIAALADELQLRSVPINPKTLREFSKDQWRGDLKLQKIYGESDDLFDALMDKFELSYE